MKVETLSRKELAYYRLLWTSRGQKKFFKFALEGEKFVLDLVHHYKNSPYNLEEVLFDAVFLSRSKNNFLKKLKDEQIPFRVVRHYQLERILPSRSPQGIMAVIKMPEQTDDQRLGKILASGGRAIFLDGVQDPGNVGTLIRSSAAFGISAVVVGQDSARLYNPKTLRASAGTFLKIPVLDLVHRDAVEIVMKFKNHNFNVIALSKGKNAIPLKKFSPPKDALFIIGNEGSGIRKDVQKIAEDTVSIEISPDVESLNAAVSGSILMFHIQGK
ncbi:hypothetical protein DRQ26_02475 [bacterium]|nr:MAG: hypothetical protein DRQ26_02475 [bacterium]